MALETRMFAFSSNIAAASYDGETETMTVEFNRGGTYEASPVPASKWYGLVSDASPGSFYHRHLKGAHAWRKIA